MKQILAFPTFITVVLMLSAGMNFYILARLGGFFKIQKGVLFWAVFCICTVSLIGGTMLQSLSGNIISRIVYIVCAGWLGVMWLFFCSLIFYEILRFFIKVEPAAAGITILVVVGIVTIYSVVNAQLVRVKSLRFKGGTDIDIVQISDIHLGSVSGGFLERIIEKTNGLEPDFVVITGDLVDNHNRKTQEAIVLLGRLKAPAFFVTGNHEGYVGVERVLESLSKTKVRVLRDEAVDLGGIQVIGIEDSFDRGRAAKVLEQVRPDRSKYSVLLYHRPEGVEAVSAAGVDLMLCGHLHGGQIWPFNYVVRLVHKYMKGLYNHNGTHLYVTSGTGTWGPRMRLGSRSEITLVQIRK